MESGSGLEDLIRSYCEESILTGGIDLVLYRKFKREIIDALWDCNPGTSITIDSYNYVSLGNGMWACGTSRDNPSDYLFLLISNYLEKMLRRAKMTIDQAVKGLNISQGVVMDAKPVDDDHELIELAASTTYLSSLRKYLGMARTARGRKFIQRCINDLVRRGVAER